MDLKKLPVLVLLDLRAAYDTVDHSILLDRFHNLVGVSGRVFKWLKCYLPCREFYVTTDECSSDNYKNGLWCPPGFNFRSNTF